MNNRLFLSWFFTTVIIAVTSCSPRQDNILVLTERGGQHGPFTDAALEWLADEAAENGYAITEINTAAPITGIPGIHRGRQGRMDRIPSRHPHRRIP